MKSKTRIRYQSLDPHDYNENSSAETEYQIKYIHRQESGFNHCSPVLLRRAFQDGSLETSAVSRSCRASCYEHPGRRRVSMASRLGFNVRASGACDGDPRGHVPRIRIVLPDDTILNLFFYKRKIDFGNYSSSSRRFLPGSGITAAPTSGPTKQD